MRAYIRMVDLVVAVLPEESKEPAPTETLRAWVVQDVFVVALLALAGDRRLAVTRDSRSLTPVMARDRRRLTPALAGDRRRRTLAVTEDRRRKPAISGGARHLSRGVFDLL